MTQHIAKRSIGAAIGTGFVAMLVFVSLLGENNKVNDTVSSFFKHIKAHDYENAATYITADAIHRLTASSGMDFEDYAFIFELALLSRFDLLDHGDYRVVINRESFWVPYVDDARVEVGVLVKAKGKSLIDNLKQFRSSHTLQGLFTVKRIDGIWFITQIHLQDQSLARTFTELAHRLQATHGVVKTETGFMVEGLRYDTTTQDIELRHIYRHLLRKASRLLSHTGEGDTNG